MELEERERSRQTLEEAQEEERREREVYSREAGILKLSNMKVTDLPTNKEVILPKERPPQVEEGLQAFGAEMMEVAKRYAKENVDRDGNVNVNVHVNMNKRQEDGLKDIEQLVKDKHIVTKTDKSG